MKAVVFDIEASNLLSPALDYSSLPYKLKPDFKVWCIVFRDIRTGKVKSLRPEEITFEAVDAILSKFDMIVGHNIVGYDLPVLQAMGLLRYRIGYPGQPHELNGRLVEVYDTLLWSKLLNADRFGGHSLKAWGKRLEHPKIEFHDFSAFSEEMLDYCEQDTSTNRAVYFELEAEKKGWDWDRAYSMEIKLSALTLNQELFGMHLDAKLAQANLDELNSIMQGIAQKVDPLLPRKALTQLKLKDYTPPARKFKMNGEPSTYLLKFMEKIGAELDAEKQEFTYKGKVYSALSDEPVETHEDSTIENIDIVKSHLISLGWEPTEVKERDLIKNADKTSRDYTSAVIAVERYVKQTLDSVFKDLRLKHLGVTEDQLMDHLLNRIDGTKPVWVPATPKLTVGLEKEICPNLIALGEKAEFVKDVVHYYTYRHRRNSIAGGYNAEDDEPTTGFLSAMREDGRVPTPADTLGANTGRYRHKIVCNIPRVTSLYGEKMRALFGAGRGLYQLGYDFASLEARIMGHYVLPYTDGESLAESLLAEKPNDIHSVNGRKLGISRGDAKSFSYAAIYGAQPKKLAKMLGISLAAAKQLFEDYWNAVPALKELKAKVELFWSSNGKSYITGLDGRKLMTRSKHSLINVLFQSGGAIAAKWSAVRLAQGLENQQMLGDPFVNKISDAVTWFMIHMHDEQQLAVHPSLLKISNYATEDEAKAARVTHNGAIGHGAKGYYVTEKTAPVQAIEAAINQAVQELELKVDLGFEYIAGKNWAQCH